MGADDSFRRMMSHLGSGDPRGGDEIIRRFTRRLIGLARGRLNAVVRSKVDPDDVVQSVLRSFFARQANGAWELQDWDSIWSMLAVITVRKCGHLAEYHLAARRDAKREVSPTADGLWEPIDREPTPAETAMLADLVENMLAGQSERDRQILEYRLQGESAAEIARRVGCSENTVGRVLARARQRLERMADSDPGPG